MTITANTASPLSPPSSTVRGAPLAPTGSPVRGGAVSVDGFSHAHDSALTEILMV